MSENLKGYAFISINGERMGAQLAVSERLDDILTGKPDFNTIVFNAMRPVLEQRLQIRSDGTIHVQRPRNPVGVLSPEATAAFQESVYTYVTVGLQAFYQAQEYFDALFSSNQRVYEYKTYREYYEKGVLGFLDPLDKNMKKRGASYDDNTRKAVDAVINPSQEQRKGHQRTARARQLETWVLDKVIYMRFRHGCPVMDVPNKPVLFSKARIKNLERAVEKSVIKIVSAIELYNTLLGYAAGKNRHIDNNCLEVLGIMSGYGFDTPRSLEQSYTRNPDLTALDVLGYLFSASHIDDIFGVTYVTSTIRQAQDLVDMITENRRVNGYSWKHRDKHRVFLGTKASLRKRRVIYQRFLVEDNFEREDKINSQGNNRLDFYTTPRDCEMPFAVPVEMAVTSLRWFAVDDIGGPGSHLLYEMKRRKKVDLWRKRDKQLYALYEALLMRLAPVVAMQDEVYKLPLHKSTA